MRWTRYSLWLLASAIWALQISIGEATETPDVSLDDLLNTKISTAAKYEQTTREAPASITIVTAEDIAAHGHKTLEDVFRTVRGFYVSNDRNYSYVGTRGFGRPTDYNNRILLLINGHTRNENIEGSAAVGADFALNMDAVERIEIVRGPGSALYGTYAVFAVVNVITKSGNTLDGLSVSGELGSYGRREFGAAFGALSSGGVDLSFSGNWADVDGQELHYREFDDPATNHGIAQNLDWERYHSILGTCSAGGLSIQGYFSKREKGIPTAPWETVFNDGDARTLDRAAHADIRYERALGATKVVSFRGYLDHYYYTGAYPYEILWLDEYNGVWTGGDFRLRWDPRPNNRLILGAEYQNHLRARYRAWDSEGVHFDGSNAYSLVSLYAQDEYQATTNLSITGGLRTDHYSHAGTTTSLRGAIVYNARRSGTFKLLYGEAFRAPNVAELYYHDETAKGNPDLLPETIRTIEGVWERRLTEGLYGAVSVYGYRMKDLIDMTEDPSDGLIQYRNINTVRAAGVEVELTFRFKEKGRGYASYSYQRAEDKVSGQTLSNSPAHLVRAGASIPMGRRVAVVPELQYEGERKTVQNTKIEGYFLTSLNLSFSPRSDRPGSALLDHVELSLQVRNALDRKYATPGGFEHVQPAIAQNGRNYAVRFELGF